MKTKLFLITTFTLLLISSCIKDYTGTIKDSTDEILTKTNFSYEGDMFKFYLELEIENLNEVISKLKTISPNDAGYDQAQKELLEAKAQQVTYNEQVAAIIDIDEVGLKIGPVIPRPPCNCFSLQNSLEYVLILKGDNIKNISVFDINGKILSSSIPEFSPLPEYNNQLLYATYKDLQNIKGEVVIQISKIDNYGDLIDYSFSGYIF
ncbi:hypothetical protein [Maribacter sp. Asnod1-A12]|uniref:hypothetical protein n=1 Tax=Maribacter sp. Asnod1-A12 TaxID=3160576 RepID=UPI003864B386